MSFSKCMTSLSLHGKIPARELKDAAAEYQKRGMSANAAMIQAVEDKIEMLQMEERGIVKAVRGAYEEQGGRKKPARVKAKPVAKPAPVAAPEAKQMPRYSVSEDGGQDFKDRVLKAAFGQYGSLKGIELIESDGMLAGKMKKTGHPIFVLNGKFGRDQYKQALTEANAAGIENPKRIYVYADSITYTGQGIEPVRLDSLPGFGGDESRYSVTGGLSQAEFGPAHTEYRDDPAGAVKRLLADKTGEAVVATGAMGDISLVYGDDKTGLGHVARRRGEEFMDRLPALLRDGKEYTKPGQTDRVFIGNDRDEAVIRLQWDGKPKKWMLSAYEKYPDTKATDAPQSRRSEQAAPASKALTRDTLRAALTSGDVLGPVIDSMIESGLVVLHDGPSQLPKGVGRKVKGVQAVTMPDGTVHMVASNLTPENARAVMLHEAFHQGGKKLIGTEQWASMMGRLGSLYSQSEKSTGKAKEFFDRARERVAAAKKKGAVAQRMEVEEFAAYAIEEYETNRDGMPAAIRKWVEDLIGLVKAWMVKRYGRQIGQVTPAQLAAMAKWAIMDVAVERRGEMFGPVGEMFSADESVLSQDDIARALDVNRWLDRGLKLGAKAKIYRGVSERTGKNTSNFGRGLYTTTDKKEAAMYGTVHEMTRDDVPSNPLRFTTEDAFRGWESFVAREIFGYRRMSDFAQAKGGADQWVRELDPAVDGIQIGTGHGAFFVKFPTIKESLTVEPRFSVTDDTDTTTTATPPEPNRYTPPEQNLARRVQAAVQDNQNRVKEVQERIMDKTGLTTLGKADLYGAETNRPGRIAARREDFADKMLRPLVEKLAKAGHTPEQLASLLHAMHAKERNEAIAKINPDMPDGGSGMTNDQAEATLALHKDDRKLHALAKEARAIARATLDLKLAYGLITPEYHDLLTTQYENYVPLKGDAEYGPKIKRAMGHEEREEHILENVARDYEQAVVVGEKNLARQSLLQMALKFPDEDLWTVGVPPKGRYVAGKSYSVERNGKSEAVFTSMPQVNAFLEAKGAEAANYKVLDSAGEQVVEFTKPLQDNEVMVYVNGDPVRIQIKDETLARQLRPLDSAQMGPILEGMRSLNRYLSKIYTGYNPAFILRNATRDAMTGSINMLGNQGAAVTAKAWAKYPGALKAMYQWAKSKNVPDSKMGRYLDEYRQNGGKTGASYMSDLEAQAETIQHMYDDAYGASGYLRDGKRGRAAVVAGRKIIGGMAHVVEVMNQATENALRLALYTALREEGISAGRAAQAAKGVTVDFDRKGAQTGALGAIYLFFNPAVQGVANGMKTLAKGEHKAQAWAALGGLALLGYYAAAAGMGDDKDRWLGEAWDKRTKNLMLNVGDKQIRVPLSQEFAPAYALGVALAEGMNGEKPTQTAARIVSSFIDAYFPLAGVYNQDSDNHAADIAQAVTPTVARPFIESAMNRNAFGSQIVPETPQTKDRPDNLKMNRATKGTPYDAAAQGIASIGEMMGAGKYENDITKVSPETLKSLWRTYTGGLGQFVTDSIGVASMGASDPSVVEASEVPIIKDFVHEQGVKPIRGRYYALSRDARRAATEFQMAKKAGDGAAMDEIVKDADKLKLVSLGKLIEKTGKAITALADEKVDVQAQTDLSAAEKRAKVREIEQEEEKIYREAIEAFK